MKFLLLVASRCFSFGLFPFLRLLFDTLWKVFFVKIFCNKKRSFIESKNKPSEYIFEIEGASSNIHNNVLYPLMEYCGPDAFKGAASISFQSISNCTRWFFCWTFDLPLKVLLLFVSHKKCAMCKLAEKREIFRASSLWMCRVVNKIRWLMKKKTCAAFHFSSYSLWIELIDDHKNFILQCHRIGSLLLSY